MPTQHVDTAAEGARQLEVVEEPPHVATSRGNREPIQAVNYGDGSMEVKSSRFGTFEVDPDRALTFEQGLLGFPDSVNYVVVEVEESPYVWLQSAEEEEVAFLATSPFLFFPDYDLVLSDEHQTYLAVDSPDQVEILTLLTIQRAGERADDPAESITANLLGPIVVNIESRKAVQLVLDNPDYSTRVPVVA